MTLLCCTLCLPVSPKVADEALCELSAIPQQNSLSSDSPSPCKGVFGNSKFSKRLHVTHSTKNIYSLTFFSNILIFGRFTENVLASFFNVISMMLLSNSCTSYGIKMSSVVTPFKNFTFFSFLSPNHS